MAPRRLTEAEKQEILDLYRHPEESTSTLASRFGVSNSTISRIVKQGIPDDEYEALVQQKRSGPRSDFDRPSPAATPPPVKKKGVIADQLPIFNHSASSAERVSPPSPKDAYPMEEVEAQTLEEIEEDLMDLKHRYEDIEVLEDDLDDVLEEDDDDDLEDDLDDDLEEEDDLDDEEFAIAPGAGRQLRVEILPFASAKLPRTCYVVVDRSSELITRPLKEFAELGQIPDDETQAKTLPIFDNHRVARRFSRRMQRVVKVPDGRMIYKVTESLQSKGITRLLIDGQVYSLP